MGQGVPYMGKAVPRMGQEKDTVKLEIDERRDEALFGRLDMSWEDVAERFPIRVACFATAWWSAMVSRFECR